MIDPNLTPHLRKLAEAPPTLRQPIRAGTVPLSRALPTAEPQPINDHQLPDAEPQQRPIKLEGDHAQKAQGTGRTALRFTLRRVRLLDPCAKYGSCKALIDGLRYAGLIHNDREEDITLEVTQEKVAHYAQEETLISITYP